MIGTKLAHYEVTSHLGTGGMGEVFQATDSKLGRSVAIKLLPEVFTHDADRAARFEREARVLASLNHPNIAAIYGIEESGGRKFLVMELVGGETLAERIQRGALPIDETLAIANEIAVGLEAAHEKGIIHRDLKPANVKIAPDGKVKILDFGLAKDYEPETGNSNLSNSPTLSFAATQAGIILGTAAYMSPEQTRGRAVDKRTDIFAFGCVLYEMLTGLRAFEGEDVIEILGRVVTAEPDFTRLPGPTPPAIRRLLKRALKKDPRQRLGDIHDARIEIEEARTEESASPNVIAKPEISPSRRPVVWIAATVVLLLIAVILGGFLLQIYRSQREPSIASFFIAVPDRWVLEQTFNGPMISPDGTRVAFVVRNAGGKTEIWVRSLDNLVAQSLPGTDGAYSPFWSANSRSLAFFTQNKLKRIDVAAGAVQNLCDAANGRGGTWNRDGMILFGSGTGPLFRVPAAGGQAVAVSMLSAGQSSQRGPSFLPDGKHYLYFAQGSPETRGIYVSSLDGGEPRRLFDAESNAIYAPPGYLLFVQNGAIMRRAFNAATLQIVGDPAPVADSAAADGSFVAAVSVSENGTLVYRNTAGLNDSRQLGLFDRTGKLIDRIGPPGRYIGMDLSPDGNRLAVHRHDDNGGDIWLIELLRGTMSRFTFDATADNSMPIWSPDGTSIVFSSVRSGKWGLYQKPANGSGKEQLLYESAIGDKAPMSWSADGKYIVFQVTGAKTEWDLWVLPLTGDRKAYPMVDSPFNETWAQVSPDSKWVVYNSDETGRYEIYIRPFPMGEGKWQVSTNGGWYPRWSKDGKELFFADAAANGKLMAMRVNNTGSTPVFSPASPLFDSGYINIAHGVHHKYAVSPDGQHFIIPRPESSFSGESSVTLPPPITVVLNWASSLDRK